MLNVTSGSATRWSAGQDCLTGYAMWLRWLREFKRLPSQQLGKTMRRRRGWSPRQVGTSRTGTSGPGTLHAQAETPSRCGFVAAASPATILSPPGKALTWR